MVGPYLWPKWELGPAVEGTQGATVGGPWSTLVSGNSLMAGQDTLPYWQGFLVRIWQGMGCVGAPAPASHCEGRTWDWDVS